MATTRRNFVKLIATVPLALSLPRLIGDEAGGFYAPIPEDIAPYLTWHWPVADSNRLLAVWKCSAQALWAPLGSSQGHLQLYGGTLIGGDNRELLKVKQQNLHESMRTIWEEDHYPGWLRVLRSEATGDEPDQWRHWHEWTRVGYMQWLKPGELAAIQERGLRAS